MGGHLKLPRHVLPAFILINALILSIYIYASLFVLPKYPLLHPVAVLLFILAETALYLTLSTASLQSYRSALSSKAHLYRRCEKCDQPRPPRTHHCSKCRSCTPRMSHHCGILRVCIGAHNVKPFLLLLFYAFVSGLITFLLSLPETIDVARRVYARELPLTVPLLIRAEAFYAQIALAVATFGILLYHCYFICIGWTILEAYTVYPGPRLFPPWRHSKGSFDRGWRNNLREVFGTGYRALLPMLDTQRVISTIADEEFEEMSEMRIG